jgi:hypothetical protein
MAKVSSTHGKYKGVLVSITDMRKLKAKLADKKKEVTDLIVLRFQQIGEEAVKIAREVGSYNDVTGNLRSSIGYLILVDGKPVINGATKQYAGTQGNGSKGVQQGQELLQKLKAKFPYGIVLIIAAGMEYAAFVENVRGKDVLTSAQLLAEDLMKKLLNNIITD